MSEDVMSLLFLVVIGLITAVSIWMMFKAQQTQRREWDLFAARTGLTRQPGTMQSIAGSYRARPVRLFTSREVRPLHPDRTSQYTTLDLTVTHPAHQTLLIVSRVPYFEINSGDKRIQPVTTGDAPFDEQFVVASNSPDFTDQVLSRTDQLRRALIQLPRVHLTLEGGTLRYQILNVDSNPERLIALLKVMSDLADAIEAVAGGGPQSEAR